MLSLNQRTVLAKDGWVKLQNYGCDAHSLEAYTFALAKHLGTPVRGRPSSQLLEVLRPLEPKEAHEASLSRKFGLTRFPLHIDTAHWILPARYIVLSCLFPGSSAVSTLLVNQKDAAISNSDLSIARTAVFLVKNGKRSFYSSIINMKHNFIRYDPGCMEPQSADAIAAIQLFSFEKMKPYIQEISWQRGDSLIIDNWRMLHARADASIGSGDRLLLRCLVS